MERKIQDFVADYISKNPAIREASRKGCGTVSADGLDFYPLSRAVKAIAAKRGGRLFAICSTEDAASSLFSDLADDKDILSVLLPANGKQLYSDFSLTSSEYEQKKALDTISEMKSGIVISSLRAFVSPVMSPESLDRFSVRLRKGDAFKPIELSDELTKAGYYRSPTCYEAGSFSIRGEVMDIFPFSFDDPVRIYGEWDEIGRIAEFDPLTQKSTSEMKSVNIPLISGDSSPLFSTMRDYINPDDFFFISGVERVETSWKAMQNEARARFSEAYKKDEAAVVPDKLLFQFPALVGSEQNGGDFPDFLRFGQIPSFGIPYNPFGQLLLRQGEDVSDMPYPFRRIGLPFHDADNLRRRFFHGFKILRFVRIHSFHQIGNHQQTAEKRTAGDETGQNSYGKAPFVRPGIAEQTPVIHEIAFSVVVGHRNSSVKIFLCFSSING